jgi:hypothetical protein
LFVGVFRKVGKIFIMKRVREDDIILEGCIARV